MKYSQSKSILAAGFFISLTLMFVLIQSCEKENENESKISSNGSGESHHTGIDCMSCHKQGGSGEGWFNIAGTVYESTKTSGYPNASVKLYTGPNGTGTLKYTIQVDALGNFYTTDNIDFGSGLYVAVQGNTLTKNMSSAVTAGQCNSCHGVSTDKIWTN